MSKYGLARKHPPTKTFYTERVDGKPFTNCRMYALCTILRWAGYSVPAKYGMVLRVASGVAIYDAQHQPQGTNAGDARKALNKLNLPGVSMSRLGFDQLHAMLTDSTNPIVASVTVRAHRMPYHLRRWVGYSWVGLHEISILAYSAESDEYYILDPMGKPSKNYAGEWVDAKTIRPAFVRGVGGTVLYTYATKGASYGL